MRFTPFRTNYRGRKVVAALGTTVLSVALCTLSSAPSSFAQTAKLVGAGKIVRTADGGSSVSKLKGIEAAAAAESKATFSVTYTSTGSDSQTKFTIEQKLPDQLFKSSSGEAIYDGKKTYYCSTDGKGATCVVYGAIGSSPLEGLVEVYSAGTYVTIMQTLAKHSCVRYCRASIFPSPVRPLQAKPPSASPGATKVPAPSTA